MIKKKDGEWFVYSEGGKKLSRGYATEKEAKKRLQEIELLKSQGNSVRVNAYSTITANQVQRDTTGGIITIKDVVPIIDDCVMNSGLYPKEEIDKSFLTLDDTPAPLHHPKDENGNFISAKSGKALAANWIGAYNENVRKEGDKVLLDVKVNVDQCKAMFDGKRFLQRLDEMEKGGDPIHVSTGLLLNRRPEYGTNAKGQEYDWVGENFVFDHNAILLDEPGAGTPEDGIGMFANAAGEQLPVLVANINDCSENGAESDSITDIDPKFLDDLDEPDRKNLMLLLTKFIKGVFKKEKDYNKAHGFKPDQVKTNNEDIPLKEAMKKKLANMGYKGNMDEMSDDDMMNAYEDLVKKGSKKTDEKTGEEADEKAANAAIQSAVSAAVSAAVKPLQDQLAANADAEKSGLVSQAVSVVPGLTEDAAKALDVNSLKSLIDSSGTAYHVSGAFNTGAGKTAAAVDFTKMEGCE